MYCTNTRGLRMPPVNSGRLSMNWGEKFAPRSLVVASSTGTSAVTSTVCCTSPSSSWRFRSSRCATRTSTPERVSRLKPGTSTVIV